MDKPVDANCWDCRHQQIGSKTLLGHCLWPLKNGNGPARQSTGGY